MDKIRKITLLWISLSYRELIQTLVSQNMSAAILILIVLHLYLLLGLIIPGTSWGMYGCSITMMAILWNALLDRSWEASWQEFIFQREQRAKEMRPANLAQQFTKIFSQHLRLWFLALVALLLAIPLFIS